MCQIVRVGRMELRDNNTRKLTSGLRRPFGVAGNPFPAFCSGLALPRRWHCLMADGEWLWRISFSVGGRSKLLVVRGCQAAGAGCILCCGSMLLLWGEA